MAARPPRPAADRGADVSEAGASSGSLPLDGVPLLGVGGSGGGPPLGGGGGGGGGSSLVAHVVVVGFHASLGNRIEFSYPPLRGCVTLRSPRLSDTWDIGAEPTDAAAATGSGGGGGRGGRGGSSPFGAIPSPPAGGGGSGAAAPLFGANSGGAPVVVETRGSWGALPPEWSFLPFMALPDGVHEETAASVFFLLPGGVHAVAAFRQADAARTRRASASAGAPAAARGVPVGGQARPSQLGDAGVGGGGGGGGGGLEGHPGRPGGASGNGPDGGGDASEAAAAAAAAAAGQQRRRNSAAGGVAVAAAGPPWRRRGGAASMPAPGRNRSSTWMHTIMGLSRCRPYGCACAFPPPPRACAIPPSPVGASRAEREVNLRKLLSMCPQASEFTSIIQISRRLVRPGLPRVLAVPGQRRRLVRARHSCRDER